MAGAQENLLEQRNWFERYFFDWRMPWWTAIVLYCVVAAGWVLCFFFTLLYGVTFTEDQVGGTGVRWGGLDSTAPS